MNIRLEKCWAVTPFALWDGEKRTAFLTGQPIVDELKILDPLLDSILRLFY